jgi:cation diffusion facilitator CzcD-associated flavoprotein CzcO
MSQTHVTFQRPVDTVKCPQYEVTLDHVLLVFDAVLQAFGLWLTCIYASIGRLFSKDRCRYLLAEGLRVTIYERLSEVGGLWYPYDPLIPTNAYETLETLETNVPRHLMTFSRQPWPKSTKIFPRKETTATYLHDLACGLLEQYPEHLRIKYRGEVIDLRKSLQAFRLAKWKLHIRDLAATSCMHAREYFDAVVVSTGNYSKEFVPTYDGYAEWKVKYGNTVSHSKTYCNSANFRDKVCKLSQVFTIKADKSTDRPGG